MVDKYLGWLLRYRWAIIVATFLLVGFLASGAQFLKFTSDYRIFFGPENPQLKTLETLHATYVKDDTILFIITPQNGNVFTRKTLSSVEWLTDHAWEIPYVQRVDSLQNFQHSYGENDELIVHDLFENAEELGDDVLKQIESIALSESLLKDRLVADGAAVTGVHVTVQLPGVDEEHEVPAAANYARGLAKQLIEKNPQLQVRLTGGLMMSNAFPEASLHDIESLVPIMFLFVFITLAALLRSVSATVWALLVILFSIAATMGAAGWLGFKLSPPSAVTPNIILTIAVADCVHMLVSFLHEMRSGWVNTLSWKAQRIEAAKQTLRINLQPIFITSLTTALGFLSLNFSDSPPFNDLGTIVAIGVIFAFILSIVFLPTLMIVMPINTRPYRTEGNKAILTFSEFVIAHRTKLLASMVCLAVVLIALAPKNELNDDFVKYFSTDNPFRSATEYATDHLTGMYSMEYSIRAKGPGGINEPTYLRVLENFSEWYKKQPETEHVYSVADIFKRLNKNMHNEDPDWYRVPESRELAAQYLLLYEMSLPEGLELNDRINVDQAASRFSVTIKTLSSNQMLELEKRAHTWLKNHAPGYMISNATSPNLIFSHISYTNIRSMLVGTLIALLLISFTLILALKSFSFGILSLIPNILPAAMAFGLWAAMNGQITLSLSVVATLTLGIVVDDTVHFLSKYLHARRGEQLAKKQAVIYAFTNVGTAIWVTSLVLICGFLVLTFSDFEINAQLGLMTAITILFALLTDFLLLPPLLLLWDRKDDS